jgi:hypothetical protein
MKQFLISLMLLSVLNQAFNTALHTLHYCYQKMETNKRFYTIRSHATLENQGKFAVLVDILAKNDGHKKEFGENFKTIPTLFFKHIEFPQLCVYPIIIKDFIPQNYTYTDPVHRLSISGIFHPPSVA